MTAEKEKPLAATKTDTAIAPDGAPDPQLAVEVLLAGGRYAEALPYLGEMVDGSCRYLASALLTRAGALVSLEHLPEALVDTERAIALRPPNLRLLCGARGNRAWLLARTGRYEESLGESERALDIAPDDAEVESRLRLNRALALSHLGRREEAWADYDRALSLAPDDPAIRYDRACVLSKEGRFPEALEELGLAVVGDPERRGMALADDDFDTLAADAEFGPQFRRLVGDGTDGLRLKRQRVN
jgi:tetratricopeptide (TPR) repeat protein